MDISLLDQDELIIEFEIRGLGEEAKREVTAALRDTLTQRIKEEQTDICLKPQEAHIAARKQPQTEATVCWQKVLDIYQQLREQLAAEQPELVVQPVITTRLEHVQGRIFRSSLSPTFHAQTAAWSKTLRQLVALVAQIKNKRITRKEAKEQLDRLSFNRKKTRDRQELMRQTVVPETDRSSEEDEEDSEDESFFKLSPIKTATLTYQDGDFLGNPKSRNTSAPGGAGGSTKKHSSRNSSRQFTQGLSNNSGLSDAKLRREVSTWKVRFEGHKSSLTVERFLVRMEWHANRASIALNDLVGVLDLCLEGDALDWFWTSVDRNPDMSWEVFRQEMLIRFASSRTDDDVRRMLNNRKQVFPRESFMEFYQAIHGITLQTNKEISDDTIYTILRRNMRPGLQMALHSERSFRNLGEFARRCSSLEEMWKRLGHNPEAGLTPNPNNFSSMRLPDRSDMRLPGRFERYSPRVHELDWETVEAEESYENERYSGRDESPDLYEQVCEINDRLKRRVTFQEQNRTLLKKPERYTQGSCSSQPARQQGPSEVQESRSFRCWNCNDPSHSYVDCRDRITRIFCFGCGEKGVLRPYCTRCKPPENWRSEMGNTRKLHLMSPEPRQRSQTLTEEVASNTDPELYRRRNH